MLTKIILTALIVGGCFWFVSSKRASNRQPILVVAGQQDQRRETVLRRAAWGFMFVMVMVSSAMIYREMADEYTTVTVHLVNTHTGLKSSYQARREDVKVGSFTTLDGREVYLADTERLEVEAP